MGVEFGIAIDAITREWQEQSKVNAGKIKTA
jgi:hypothetical protein